MKLFCAIALGAVFSLGACLETQSGDVGGDADAQAPNEVGELASEIGAETFVDAADSQDQPQVSNGDALSIVLTWRTPGVVNAGDDLGSDLDLHFLHPLAEGYYDVPFDAFWANPAPNWGSLPSSADDPSLASESTDGAAPEIITMAVPEQNARYCVGVHFWDDHDLGNAFASVRIYLYGVLAFAANDVELRHRDLWEVACINSPSGTVESLGSDAQPRITPDFNNPRYFQP